MPYVIPSGFGLVIVGIDSTEAIASASIRFGVDITNPDTITQAEFNTFANTLRDTLKLLWDANWRIGPVRMPFVNSAGELLLEDLTTELGTAANTDYSPPAAAYVVTKRTPFRGVANRGRFYLPGVKEDEVSEGGFISTTGITRVQGVMDTLLAAVSADPVIDSMVLLHSEGSPVSTPRLVNALQVQGIVGTMRPRQSRRSG